MMDEEGAAWHRMRAQQERRLEAQTADPSLSALHRKLARLHERALETADNRLSIVEDR